MGLKICLDTNVFIALMNKESNSHACELIFDAIENHRIKATISTIVVVEVLVGFYKGNLIQEKDKFINKLKIHYEILPISLAIAEKGAEIRAQNKTNLPDALITATALVSEADILISNDFSLTKLSRLPVFSPEEFISKHLLQQK